MALYSSQQPSKSDNTEAGVLHILKAGAASLQAAMGADGKPLLGRISSKVGGLLEELNDMLGAFEGIPASGGEP